MKKATWERIDDKTKKLAPLLVFLLVLYLYSSFINSVLPKNVEKYIGYILITYFIAELVIKYLAVRDFSKFIKKYWFEIILIIPFFKSLRVIGVVSKSAKLLKYIPYVRKLLKIPKIIKSYFSDEDSKD